ncbi:MAG: sodium:proton antiporter, partial [Gammaproteobacteria bacterium]|nr:sodium:proton antiporter [Gammaproteobacteria bacterium]
FHELLMDGMLSFLLFAGALNIDISHLQARKWEIGLLASLGTVLSTILVAALVYELVPLFGLQLSFIYCLLFGALISPTDPIAVLALFKSLNVPRQMSVFLEGESLFNDGVGIVIFLSLYQLAFNGQALSFASVSTLFVEQAVGGLLYGAGLGLLAYFLLKPIDDHKIEILVTLAIVSGGYALAQWLHVSGPLAMVVAGLFIGNQGRYFYMSKKTRESLEIFWEVVDDVLNAVLFLLIGLELLVLDIHLSELLLALAVIPLVLIVRWLCVATPMAFFKRRQSYSPYMIYILTWGGLRGGLAVALALALPAVAERQTILTMTYAVVIFSILVQGLTIRPLLRKSLGKYSVQKESE